MEEIVIYLLKSSGLLATFFLAYHFLLRKETFFTSNRWFLLSGLATSILLPLFFIKKIVYVERPKFTLPIISEDNDLPIIIDKATPIIAESIDWFQILFIVYAIVATILIIKVIIDLVSLGKLLRKQNIQKQEDLLYVNINQDIAPFSFFNYIVFNSNLYSQKELESILLHEKVHSQEKHSIDVLVTKLFTVIFWFNPLVWLYQKAIIQNLEYIADSKAIQNIEDKKCYQMALLKVVSHQNCLPITNHFYQSLIKKRIVMLNKNQSKKRNLWKYGLILPVIIAFVFLFQIKVVAQEKEEEIKKEINKAIIDSTKAVLVQTMTTKDATDKEIEEDSRILKEQHGIDYTFSKIKRNSKGEITAIRIEFDDHKGHKGVSETDGDEPIETIFFTINDEKIGFSDTNDLSGYEVEEKLSNQFSTEIKVKKTTSKNNFLSPPTPPIPPAPPIIAMPEISFPKLPKAPNAPSGTPLTNEKEWKKFDKKISEFEEKMKALEPEIEAYTLKMANVEEQMKPFEIKMKAFEEKMEVYEIQMKEYQEKMEAIRKKENQK
jgi:uncharacterized membrane protein YciS (DUF1049 family)